VKRILKHSFSLLNIDYRKLDNRWNYNSVISPYYRIYLIDEGEGAISNLHQKLGLEPGYLYIIPSFTLCNLNCSDYLGVYFVHFFEDSNDGISLFQYNRSLMKVQANDIDNHNFKRLLEINPGRGINRSDNPRIYEKNNYYLEYEELNNMQRPAAFFETQGILLQLISRFLDSESFDQRDLSAIPSKILETISYINMNLKEHLTVALLAERANQNQDYFSRLFVKYTGIRPINYLQQKRIERAQYLMTRTTMSFEQIAADTGFESLPHFFKLFKRITSLTPDQFRKGNTSIEWHK
jgi:AraC-like DNA-binding protein